MGNKKSKLIPVFVTTCVQGRIGFFFGYVEKGQDLFSDKIKLLNSRNVRYLNCAKGGVLGTAVTGPESGSKVSPTVAECYIRDVTSVTPCTPEASRAWEQSTWN